MPHLDRLNRALESWVPPEPTLLLEAYAHYAGQAVEVTCWVLLPSERMVTIHAAFEPSIFRVSPLILESIIDIELTARLKERLGA